MAQLAITDLPLEMLVEILQYLPPSDRREALLVCHKFYDACQHPRFTNDRHLHFHYCVLAEKMAPVSVFMRSPRAFHALTMSYFDCEKPIDEFWLKLGSTIEYLEFNGFCDFGIYLPAVLNRFPALKTLKLDCDFEFSRRFVCRMPSLETLVLTFNAHAHYGDDGEDDMTDYHNLIAAMPQLRHIELLVYCGSYDALLQFVIKYSTKVRALTFQVLPDDAPTLQNFMRCIGKMKTLRLTKLCITYLGNNWAPLEELLERQPQIEYLEVGASTFANKRLPSVRRFEISLDKSVQSFDRLELMDNLETFIVLGSYGDTNCFFGHKPIPNRKIKEIQLHDLKFRLCLACFEAMVVSCPQLEVFHSTGNYLENCHVSILQKYASRLRELKISDHTQITDEFLVNNAQLSAGLRNLETLDISGAFKLNNQTLLQWPHMPNLREIAFGKIFDVNIKGIGAFLSKCPALENFNIHETLRLTNDILRLIFTTLKRLKHFRIYNEFEEDSVDRKNRPWLEITRGCRMLQSLRIIDPMEANVDVKYQLFQRIRSLKVILHANHDIMTRASCFSISNYVKAIGVPYSKLGKLQEIIEKYSDSDCDYEYVPI